MSKYKGLFTFDVDNHRYVPVEQADGLISDMNYHPEPEEEPKVGYIIDPMEEDCVSADDSGYEEPDVERAKELGIWLETKEEAEKAVEKLKAWKRLKDGGITFKNWIINQTGTIDCFATWGNNIPPSRKNPTLLDDLDLLFGGEE